MTDLEMTKLCAEAMGLNCSRFSEYLENSVKIISHPFLETYDPLHDDAQAMALVDRCEIWLNKNATEGSKGKRVRWYARPSESRIFAGNNDLKRAIVECVAKMQQAKHG